MLTVLAVLMIAPPTASRSVADTLRLRVGSPEIDLSKMRPHYARVVVERFTDGAWTQVSEWTNRLEVGDSAGRGVHRWTTIGKFARQPGDTVTWNLYQTFDRKTIAPLALKRTVSDGSELTLAIDGPRIRGQKKQAGAVTPVSVDLSRAGFPLGATDLVPSGVRLREGLVMTFPAWSFGLADVESHVFTVLGRKDVPIEGKPWHTWAIEERSVKDGATSLVGTWYLADEPPYMVYAEVAGPNGTKQRMTEVLVR